MHKHTLIILRSLISLFELYVTIKYLKYGRSHKFFPGFVSRAESEFYVVED